MDIRLKTAPFEWEGTVYNLCCNMNVLADVQEAFNGDLDAAVSQKSSLRGVLEFLAAMLNDASENIGASERFTARELGRKLPVARRVEVQKPVHLWNQLLITKVRKKTRRPARARRNKLWLVSGYMDKCTAQR